MAKEKAIDHKLEELRRAAPSYWSWRSMRVKLAMLLCMAYFSVNISRTAMSVAVVCMVNSTALALNDQENTEWLFPNNRSNGSKRTQDVPAGCEIDDAVRVHYEGSFVWTPGNQGWLFSSLYWGCTFTAIAAGWLSDRYGPKKVILLGAGIVTLGTVITPLTANFSLYAVIPARFVIGVGAGLLVPATSAIVTAWFPAFEKSTTAAMYTAGNQLASIVGNPLSAFLCEQKHFLDGWPAIFYVCTLICCVFLTLWTIFATSSPEKNRFTSEAEKNFIARATAATPSHRKGAARTIPWKCLLTSRAMIAATANMCAAFTITNFLQTYLPTYYKDVLLFDISQNGLLSALPFICMFTVKMTSAPLFDRLKRKSNLAPTVLCKIPNSIAAFGASGCLMGLVLMDCSTALYAVALSSLATGFMGFYSAGFVTSLLCIAPRYSGTVNAIAVTVGNVTTALMPYLIAFITVHGTVGEWRIVFVIMIGVLITAAVLFIVWGSAEIQPWAQTQSASVATISGADNLAFEKTTEDYSRL